MQDQVNRESVAITADASKLTAKQFAALLLKTAKAMKNRGRAKEPPRGRQSVKDLMKHSQSTSTIPIEGDRGLFDRIARKYHVDYAFHKTGQGKYLLLFKSGQADAITAAFSEYSKRVINRAKEKRIPIKEQYRLAYEQSQREQTQRRERKREKVHEDR